MKKTQQSSLTQMDSSEEDRPVGLNPIEFLFMCQYVSTVDLVSKMAVLNQKYRKMIKHSKIASSRSIKLHMGSVEKYTVYSDDLQKVNEYKTPKTSSLGFLGLVCTKMTLLFTSILLNFEDYEKLLTEIDPATELSFRFDGIEGYAFKWIETVQRKPKKIGFSIGAVCFNNSKALLSLSLKNAKQIGIHLYHGKIINDLESIEPILFNQTEVLSLHHLNDSDLPKMSFPNLRELRLSSVWDISNITLNAPNVKFLHLKDISSYSKFLAKSAWELEKLEVIYETESLYSLLQKNLTTYSKESKLQLKQLRVEQEVAHQIYSSANSLVINDRYEVTNICIENSDNETTGVEITWLEIQGYVLLMADTRPARLFFQILDKNNKRKMQLCAEELCYQV